MVYKWWQRNPTILIEIQHDLGPEDGFYYNLILDHLYKENRPLRDNDKQMAALLRIRDVRKWKAIKRRLLKDGAIFIERGYIDDTNARTTRKTREHITEMRRAAGRRGGIGRGSPDHRRGSSEDLLGSSEDRDRNPA